MFIEIEIAVRRPDFDTVHCETHHDRSEASCTILSIGKMADSYDHGSSESLLFDLSINKVEVCGLTKSEAVRYLDGCETATKGTLSIKYWQESGQWRVLQTVKETENEYLFDSFDDVRIWLENRYLQNNQLPLSGRKDIEYVQ